MSASTQPPSLDADVPSLDSQHSSLGTQLKIPSLDHVVWTKATTKNGQSYEVGVAKASADFKSRLQVEFKASEEPVFAHGEQQSFSVTVDWPVGDQTYKTTSSTVYDIAGISKYRLYKNDGWINVYDYVLDFENNVNYEFVFHDEEGDKYHVTTLVHGNHYVKYNSKKPTIKKVSSRDGKGKELFG